MVQDGAHIQVGDVLAKIPRETTKTKDITGGLPRVAELFEARKPKEVAIITEIDGSGDLRQGHQGQAPHHRHPDEEDAPHEYLIPKGKNITVNEGDYVRAGEALMDGAANPHDILKIKGEGALARYLVDEVQEVYRLQGVKINDKHIEVIVRQMLRRVKVRDVGDTDFLVDEVVEKFNFERMNRQIMADGRYSRQGGAPAPRHHQGQPVHGFLPVCGFVPGDDARADRGCDEGHPSTSSAACKENVIMGRLIPAGTGFAVLREAGHVVHRRDRGRGRCRGRISASRHWIVLDSIQTFDIGQAVA